MCIPLTPVLYFLTSVIIEVYSQCFTESVSLRDIGTSTSRPEISSPNYLYLKAVKGAHIGSALTGATSELTNSNRKKNSHKTPFSLLRVKLRTRLHSFLLFIYLKLKKKGNTSVFSLFNRCKKNHSNKCQCTTDDVCLSQNFLLKLSQNKTFSSTINALKQNTKVRRQKQIENP